MNRCPKHLIKEDWMKEMLNWDLFTHPEAENFARTVPDKEKPVLSRQWQDYMAEKNVFISFYERKTQQQILATFHKRSSAPRSSCKILMRSLPVSCPVQSISIYDLRKEMSNLKRDIKARTKQSKEREDERVLPILHQKFHVVLDIKIKGTVFKLKTLMDTGSNLNLLDKDIIPTKFWQKTQMSAVGLGNKPT